jgi:hypothetical protein
LECFEKEPPTPTNSEPPAEAIAAIESAEIVAVTPSDSGSAQTNGNIASEVTSSDTESEESKEESNRDATSDFDTDSEADSSEPPYEALNQYVALPFLLLPLFHTFFCFSSLSVIFLINSLIVVVVSFHCRSSRSSFSLPSSSSSFTFSVIMLILSNRPALKFLFSTLPDNVLKSASGRIFFFFFSFLILVNPTGKSYSLILYFASRLNRFLFWAFQPQNVSDEPSEVNIRIA